MHCTGADKCAAASPLFMPDVQEHHFVSTFGARPVVVASAPGRVNLIGEHTDYHQGLVLPTVIPQSTTIRLRPRGDQQVRVASAEMHDGVHDYALGSELPTGTWIDYVQGVTAAARLRGFELKGFEAAVTSTVPPGAGVSSSAAMTVALLRALREAGMLPINDVEIAGLAQAAETEFVGAPIGIMDQMACSLSRPGEALFLDTRSLHYERITLPTDAALIVIDSGITHEHATGQYGVRRQESFDAARALGVRWLRDATLEMIQTAPLSNLQRRRARHVVTENQRVLASVRALRAGNLRALGELLNASHASQRDDYQTSTPQIDQLVEVGIADPRVYGARLTGGGFGGSVVMLAEAGAAAAAADRILAEYQRRTANRGTILLPVSGEHITEHR
jgi:galactokinase